MRRFVEMTQGDNALVAQRTCFPQQTVVVCAYCSHEWEARVSIEYGFAEFDRIFGSIGSHNDLPMLDVESDTIF
jgi:hypothetical protein